LFFGLVVYIIISSKYKKCTHLTGDDEVVCLEERYKNNSACQAAVIPAGVHILYSLVAEVCG